MNAALIDRIKVFLYKNESNDLLGIPATDEEILGAEKYLETKFNEDYIQFIKLFGGSCVGLSIYAFNNGSLLGSTTVVELTRRFRKDAGEMIPSELKDAYAISDDGSGNPILMNKDGNIFIFLHDSWEVELLYHSLEEMLMNYFPENGGYYV